jgi:ferritin-like metal-binding protein YciE
MAPKTLNEQLIKHLTDAHSIERQAEIQMRMAPRIAGDPALADIFSRHLEETREHERLVRERLKALGADTSAVKDLVGTVSGAGFALFAKFNPDTPGKLVAHGYSYEHMELAAYALLARVAERAGDTDTVAVAGEIEAQERAMAQRLADNFDRAVDAALAEKGAEDLASEVGAYLQDAHAIEGQSIKLLEKAPELAGDDELARAYAEHLQETRTHHELIEERLRALHARPSAIKDAALRLGALNWGMFFAAQPDTPTKLAGFAYAVENLEVAAYELLRRVAVRAGDSETQALAERILAQERAAAERLHGLFDQAVEAGLSEQGLPRATEARS